jgi:hypothetical protein
VRIPDKPPKRHHPLLTTLGRASGQSLTNRQRAPIVGRAAPILITIRNMQTGVSKSPIAFGPDLGTNGTKGVWELQTSLICGLQTAVIPKRASNIKVKRFSVLSGVRGGLDSISDHWTEKVKNNRCLRAGIEIFRGWPGAGSVFRYLRQN